MAECGEVLLGLAAGRNSCEVDKWMLDTGAGFDLIGKDMVASWRRFLRDCEGSDITLCTANRDIRINKQIKLFIDQFGIEANASVLDESPPALAIGKRCMEEGWRFVWEAFSKPFVVMPNGTRLECGVEHYVPYLKVDDGRATPTLVATVSVNAVSAVPSLISSTRVNALPALDDSDAGKIADPMSMEEELDEGLPDPTDAEFIPAPGGDDEGREDSPLEVEVI